MEMIQISQGHKMVYLLWWWHYAVVVFKFLLQNMVGFYNDKIEVIIDIVEFLILQMITTHEVKNKKIKIKKTWGKFKSYRVTQKKKKKQSSIKVL